MFCEVCGWRFAVYCVSCEHKCAIMPNYAIFNFSTLLSKDSCHLTLSYTQTRHALSFPILRRLQRFPECMLLVQNPYLPCLVALGVYRRNRRIVVLHISDGVVRSICAVSVSGASQSIATPRNGRVARCSKCAIY